MRGGCIVDLQGLGSSLRKRLPGCASCASTLITRAMASPNVFVSPLSGSSPLRKSHFFLSSSPDLPSVNDIVSQSLKPLSFKSGIEAGVRASKGTAATETHNVPVLGVPVEDGRAPIQVDDSSIIEVAANDTPEVFHDRQIKAIQGATSSSKSDASPTKDKPWKKFKSKDVSKVREGDGQSKGPDMRAPLGHDYTDTINAEKIAACSNPPIPCQPAEGQVGDSKAPLSLEPAMTRRLDWTPPAQKNAVTLDSESPFSGASCSLHASSSKAQAFEQLVESYKYAETIQHDMSLVTDEDSGFLKKRKLIEMVANTKPNVTQDMSAQASEKPRGKLKAPKKKPRTITELATAAYRDQSVDESVSTTGSRDGVNHTSEKENEGCDKGKKAAAKPRKRAPKKRLPSPPKPVLLPPTEALEEVANQDFVFGTSSQLAVEQSPTFLRYLQVAMRESNELNIIDLEASPTRNSTQVPDQRPKLWDAGARDEDGELFDLEVSELAYAPSQMTRVSPERINPFGYIQDEKSPHNEAAKAGAGAKAPEMDDPFETTLEELPSFGHQALTVINSEKHVNDDIPINCKPLMKPAVPGQPGTGVTTPGQSKEVAIDETVSDESQPPQYDLYTDAQLAKEVNSYGFKAVKSRKAKIALLEQCWQSKVRSNGLGVGTSASFATKAGPPTGNQDSSLPAVPAVKRGRGRPRKAGVSRSAPQEPPPSAQPRESPARARATLKTMASASASASASTSASALAAATGSKGKRGRPSKKTGKISSISESQTTGRTTIEIPDSELDEGSDASGQSRESTSSPPPVDFSLPADEGSTSLVAEDSRDSDSSSMFAYITKAVTSAPRSTDPRNPSWHEKMLLYDPIILEDLADWLNEGQLRRVGSGEEVSVGDVKKWCESRSICCLMKTNLRGKERKRI